jgi:hypothetical protein
MMVSMLAAAGAVVAGGVASAAEPVYSAPLKLTGAAAGTEPRVSITPNDHRFVVTNDVSAGTAVVYRSENGGATFTRTATNFPGQSRTTIDVDTVALPTGRIIASELDTAGLTFPTGYSDDEGKTWHQSQGTEIPDTDRQWFAVGPKDASTGKYRVYMLFHNLASGATQHNMWVSTSTDGGETFGAPAPTTVPGMQAYLDLQCSDSGGPGSISVNQKTGQIYVVFGARTSAAGGCGASVFGPFEINVVAATRVWVVTSKDGSAGSWSESLAVDRSQTGQIVGMQLAAGAVDRAGNVFVVFPESLKQYPDYNGGAIKYVWAGADLKKWSAPVTVSPSGGPGNIVPHVIAGDAGKVAFAWYHGVDLGDGKKPLWYTTAAQTLDGLSPSPTITTQDVSGGNPAYRGTASELMGVCGSGPAQGAQNGFLCSRSTDVWGMDIDRNCRATITWPTKKNDGPHNDAGTFVSTQTGGPGLCSMLSEDTGSTGGQTGGGGGETSGGGGTKGGSSAPARLRIRFNRFGGPASRLARQSRTGGIPLRIRALDKTVRGITIVFQRVVGRRVVTVAATKGAVVATKKAKVVRLALRRGQRITPGRYQVIASARLASGRLARATQRVRLR